MTENLIEDGSEWIDAYVDTYAIREEPLKYFIATHEQLRTDAFRDYTVDQIKLLEVCIDLAYEHLSDFERPGFMNERIYIWAGLADPKEKSGMKYVPASDLEPETKKPRK